MAANSFERVKSGDPLRISARAWNAVTDAARAQRDQENSGGALPAPLFRQTGIIKVKNVTGGDLDRFSVVRLINPIIDPADNSLEFQNQVSMEGDTPAADDPRACFGVLLDPIATDGIGRAVVSGVVPCWIDLTSTGDRTCSPVPGETGFLRSEPSGGLADILWVSPDPEEGGEYHFAYVLLKGCEASQETILALLVRKSYVGPFIRYEWFEVVDDDDPSAVTYTFAEREGDNAYHEQNIDLPVYSPLQDLGTGSGTGANNSSAGNVAWTNFGLIGSSDDAYATSQLDAGQSTHYLVATGFGFDLPEGAKIVSVNVSIEGHATAIPVVDTEVKLVVGGTITGTNKASGFSLQLNDTIHSYSGTPRQWGVPTLDVADVEASNFGVAVRYQNNHAGTQTARIDHIKITIEYVSGIARHSVVRMRRGANGDYWLIDQMCWTDFFRRTNVADSDGVKGYLRFWNPNTGSWEDGEEVRIIIAE